ncbi:MAG: DUF4178 domain-containing protein [Spirochaetota bacterium]|nr:DUF4178 domain-containing protein [Spirochaetota bacterium]
MGFFKKKKKDEIDPLKDLVLSKLRVGFMLDYDMKTWQVTGYCQYDFGEGYYTDEWELTSGNEKRYLERSEDDDVEWTFSQKIPIGAVEGNVRQHIIENDDPPDQVVFKEKRYYLDESGPGYMNEDDDDESSKEFIYWDFIDEDDENFLTIEQWGETEFEASYGFYVEEYQFSNILPGFEEE